MNILLFTKFKKKFPKAKSSLLEHLSENVEGRWSNSKTFGKHKKYWGKVDADNFKIIFNYGHYKYRLNRPLILRGKLSGDEKETTINYSFQLHPIHYIVIYSMLIAGSVYITLALFRLSIGHFIFGAILLGFFLYDSYDSYWQRIKYVNNEFIGFINQS